MSNPTIVLVHGAWADATGFDAQIRALQGRGFHCIAPANPLRDVRTDAASIAGLLRSIDAPIVLAGHSYGGAVITNAATGVEQVMALVYLNGWVPDEGESVKELFERNPNPDLPPTLRPVPTTRADGSDDADLYIDQEGFLTAFAGDVDRDTARVMAAAQRPFANAAFESRSGEPAWRSIRSWYLLGTEDKAIPPDTQRFMAERAGAEITEVASSHVSYVSHPEDATALILKAVEATVPAPAAA